MWLSRPAQSHDSVPVKILKLERILFIIERYSLKLVSILIKIRADTLILIKIKMSADADEFLSNFGVLTLYAEPEKALFRDILAGFTLIIKTWIFRRISRRRRRRRKKALLFCAAAAASMTSSSRRRWQTRFSKRRRRRKLLGAGVYPPPLGLRRFVTRELVTAKIGHRKILIIRKFVIGNSSLEISPLLFIRHCNLRH